jgi:hypothetical protein
VLGAQQSVVSHISVTSHGSDTQAFYAACGSRINFLTKCDRADLSCAQTTCGGLTAFRSIGNQTTKKTHKNARPSYVRNLVTA